MKQSPKQRSYWVDDFFMIRSPLLPCDVFHSLGDSLETAARLRDGEPAEKLKAQFEADCARVRTRMQAIASDAVFREALFVSSESVHGAIERWDQAPTSKRGAAAERAILKYIQRASTRCTPYGLMSGVGVGRIDDGPSDIRLASRTRRKRHARVDSRILMDLAQAIASDTGLRQSLTFVPNSTLYEAGPRLRYFEAVGHPFSGRTQLVTVAYNDVLRKLVESSAGGARWSDLVQTIRSCDAEIEESEAVEFLEEIVASQILIPDLFPSPVGDEMLSSFVEKTRSLALPEGVHSLIDGVLEHSRRLNSEEAGKGIEPMREVAALLGTFLRETAAARKDAEAERDAGELAENDGSDGDAQEDATNAGGVFQVDSLLPLESAQLRKQSLDGLLHVIDSLYVMNSSRGKASMLSDFVSEFSRRYDDREIPLCQALDPESGIRFGTGQSHGEPSPLLHVPVGQQAATRGDEFSATDHWRLELLMESRARGESEIALTSSQIRERFQDPGRRPPPPSFPVMMSVIGSLAELDEGRARFLFVMSGGAHTLNLFGRFAHVVGDELTESLRRCAAREQAVSPSLLAEVAYLPPFKLGNICQGPSLRPYTIAYRCPRPDASGQVIPIDDILVSVRGGRVVLRSRSRGEYIQPRVDHAMNIAHPTNPAIFNFLGALQFQDVNTFVGWSWGALARSPELPRVSIDGVIVAPRSWTLAKKDVDELVGDRSKNSFATDGLPAFARVQEWRRRLGLPRHIAVGNTTDYLAADLDNPLSVDLMLRELRKSPHIQELFLDGITRAVTGEEGTYTHEIVLPVWSTDPAALTAVTKRPAQVMPAVHGKALRVRDGVLFAKIYGGESALDKLLREGIRDFIAGAGPRLGLQNWFFIRYADPLPHIRLRLFGSPGPLAGSALLLLEELCERSSGVSKLVFDAYEPEIERYGGANGIQLCERLFGIDSRFAIELLARYMAREDAAPEQRIRGVENRWLLTALSVGRLLQSFGLDEAQRIPFVESYAELLGTEMVGGVPQQKMLGALYRQYRAQLETALTGADPKEWFAPSLHEVLAERTRAMHETIAELNRRAGAGQLVTPIDSIRTSLLHMHCNRLFISQQRRQEFVLLQLLTRAMKGIAGRERNTLTEQKVAEA